MALNAPVGGWPTPSAAYIHVPFCRHRCGYCNFSVIADHDDLTERYLAAIDRELAVLDRPTISTVFIGGGTPTHLEPAALSRLLQLVRDRLDLSDAHEWTVEANPEDISAEKLRLLSEFGVNRLSLGVQSFQDDKLRTLERGHTGCSARASIELAAEYISNLSIDLIFGSPGDDQRSAETLAEWIKDLDAASEMPIQHLSTYALTFEKGTSFWSRRNRGDLRTTTDDLEVDMYVAAQTRTSDAGFLQYEVSNFAKTEFQCQHNLAYWEGQGWFATGPGAARFANGSREVNHRSTLTYLKRMETTGDATDQRETITLEQYARERAAFGIRMLRGVDVEAIGRSANLSMNELIGEAIQQSIDEGLLHHSEQNRIALTPKGVLFADTVASRFL